MLNRLPVAFALFCVVAIPLAAQTSAQTSTPEAAPDPARVQAEYEAGYDAASKGDLNAAEQHFYATVKLAPELAEAHNALGSILLAKGETAAAATEFERALAIKPLPSAAENLAVAYARSGDARRALAQFAKAAADTPLSIDAALTYAPLLVTAGRRDDAVALLQQTAASLPDLTAADAQTKASAAQIYDSLGTVLAQQAKWADAQKDFTQAIALDPGSTAHYHLGGVLLETQQPDAAATELGLAEAIAPADVNVALLHVKALNALGEADAAVAAAKRAQGLAGAKGDPAMATELEYQLALATQNTTSPGDAVPLFRDVVGKRPNDALALANLGLALVQSGKAKEAIPFYERSLKIDPKRAAVLQGLGVAYLQLNNIADAESEFRQAVALAPDAAEIHYDLGLALKLKDDLPAATVELDRAMELNPALVDPHVTLGTMLMQQGKFDDAAVQMRIVLRQQPENGDMWATLGSTLKQAGKNDEAIEALRHAIQLQPNQPGSHTTLAGILQAEGKTDEAAGERKAAASLTRGAMNRQSAMFATNAGDLLLGKGDVDGAIGQYRTAVRDDATYAPAHRQLADALDRKGQSAEAASERKLAAAAP